MTKNLSASKYYQENKERIPKKKIEKKRKTKTKCITKPFQKWTKKQQYGHEYYKNLQKDEKQKLVDYRKKYYQMRKNPL